SERHPSRPGQRRAGAKHGVVGELNNLEWISRHPDLLKSFLQQLFKINEELTIFWSVGHVDKDSWPSIRWFESCSKAAARSRKKRAPGKAGSQGGKGLHPFPGAIGRSGEL